MPVKADFSLDYKSILSADNKEKIKLVALTQASNVLGSINPVAEIIKFLRKNVISIILIM
jgi:selenocysteine lyase/cysteine desulfurase